MAHAPSSRSARIALLACAGMLTTLAGCASVAEDATMARTVTPASSAAETANTASAEDGTATAALPAAKPGTENTPEALPTPVETADAGSVPVSALAEAKSATGAAAATAALAGNTATAEFPQTASLMDADFDTGEPEGLEQLVASQKIIPLAKPVGLATGGALGSATSLAASIEQPIRKSGTPIDDLITKYAAFYGIPESLLHRVVKRESRYNPAAYNRGHYGLMQIKYATAKGMGYQGPAEGLFDAETNIKYGAKYLRGAWLVADDKNDGAVMLYASGYYYHAKRKGLLEETGLR